MRLANLTQGWTVGWLMAPWLIAFMAPPLFAPSGYSFPQYAPLASLVPGSAAAIWSALQPPPALRMIP